MTSYLGNGEFEIENGDEIIIQCECGKVWAMDYEPTPNGCEGSVWRLRVGDDWGVWVDVDGNEVQIAESRGESEELPKMWE